MDIDRLLSEKMGRVEASGIRRVFDLAASLKDPIDLSIGQPDFAAPDAIKAGAIAAITENRNGYTPSVGIKPLQDRITRHVQDDLGWPEGGGWSAMVTSGTLGALQLALMAMLDPGDELIHPDPYFVAYPHLVRLLGAKPVGCDTYPDFRMTAERVEPLITERTKAVLVNSPSNPAGVVLSKQECADLRDLCRRRGVLLISDEIYDEFVYDDARDEAAGRAPSPCRVADACEDTLLIRGFGKTYGVTGWRMGYAAGPAKLMNEMIKVQQYTFVCPPSIAQWGCMEAFNCDVGPTVARFQKRRDMVFDMLSEVTEIARPGGAFFAFPRVPERLGMTGRQFIEKAVGRSVLVINGGVFSARDTHFRLSFAVEEGRLKRGLETLVVLLRG
ncbi:MAG: aminotransferase class I/II-fold pyridoxal phosphate-dependent enzyme [Planctomycetota bacterium]|nr:aminotransferase class I/II-fold pyridoxal phosphate-dependent enzyme [Planctomycetota bacterium]